MTPVTAAWTLLKALPAGVDRLIEALHGLDQSERGQWGAAQMSSRFLRDQRGFTLVEVVAAVAVLFVVSMGTLGALTYSARSTNASTMRSSALNLANQRLEQMRNMPYDSIGVRYAEGGYGDPPGSVVTPETVDDRFKVETAVGWVRSSETGRAEYKKATVTVSWEGDTPGEVEVSTNIFGKSELVNTGDLSVVVRDLATDEVLSGAWVTATPSDGGSARSVCTGEDGEAFFGYLPSGEYAITVVKTGYAFDDSVLANVSVTADLLTQVVAYGQQPSSVVVKVVTEDGSALADASVTLSRPMGSSYTGTTGADGRVQFDDLFVDDYNVSAEAEGRSPASATVGVTQGGQVYDVELTLVERHDLTIRIVDSGHLPLSSATVSLKGPSPSTSDVPGSPSSTPENGEVKFESLAGGTYTVSASKSGYYGNSCEVTYDSSASQTIELMLWPVEYGTLVVHTVDRRGNRVGNKWVSVTGPDDYYQWFKTGSSGSTGGISGLVPGTYTVTPWGGGSAVTVSIEANQVSVVEVTVR